MSLTNTRIATSAIGALVVAMLTISMVAPAAMAATTAAPQGAIEADVTKDVHSMQWDSVLQYEADNGDLTTLNAEVNESADNPYQFTASDIEAEEYGAFPRVGDDNNSASALDASEWTTSGATVSDTETASNVEAISVSPSGAGDTATYGNWSSQLDADENKRFLQLVADVNSLGSSTVVEVQIVDEDGDYKAAYINASATAGSDDVIANGTGEGYVYQRQLGKMTTQGSGDGTFDNIESVKIAFSGGSTADVDFAAINAEKTGEWTFGEEMVDSDNDDELESETVTEITSGGDVAIRGLDTLGSEFNDATLHDLTFPAEFRVQDLPSEDRSTSFAAADAYPAFEHKFEAYYRIQLPTAYDLSYSNAELTDEVAVPSGRYETVEHAEGVSDTDFADVESWSSVKASYSSEGTNVSIDDTIQPGQQIAIHYVYPVTDDEKAAMQNGGLIGGPMGDSGGGAADIPVIGTVVAALGGLWAWVTNRLPFQG